MRSLWCTLVAVCLVAGGARVSCAQRLHAPASQVVPARAAIVAPSGRRTASWRGLGAFVAPVPVAMAPLARAWVAIAAPAPARARSSGGHPPHDARGPPRA